MQHAPQVPSKSSILRTRRRLRAMHTAPVSTIGTRQAVVLHNDPYVRLLLLYLDIESIEAFIVFIGERFTRATCSWVLQDGVLWTRLLMIHFAVTGSTDPAGLHGNRRQKSSALTVYKTQYTHRVQDPRQDSRISSALVQFLAWSRARQWFDQHVAVIKGDADAFTNPGSEPFDEVLSDIDLQKRGVQARSGNFSSWSSNPEREVSVHPLKHGSRNAFFIRGRSTHARSLIHLVSPRSFLQSPWKAFRCTFTTAMDAIVCEEVRNVAVLAPCPTSGTTDRVARIGLREIQRCITQETWTGTVGVVCYEKEAFAAFKTQKERVLASFGATDW